MRFRFRFVSLLVLLATSAAAQQGDRKGEVQAPLPSHIQVPPAPVRSPEAIAAALERLLDADLRQRMGEAGRARSLEYTWEAFHRGVRQVVGLEAVEEALPA